MKIKVKTDKINIIIPVPVSMAAAVIRKIPESAFDELREKVPDEFKPLVTKENAVIVYEECKDILKKYKGLEIIDVKAHDGTVVYIRL